MRSWTIAIRSCIFLLAGVTALVLYRIYSVAAFVPASIRFRRSLQLEDNIEK